MVPRILKKTTTAWITGLYAEPGYAPGPSEDRFELAHYGADSLALFGEVSRAIRRRMAKSPLGLRWEQREADYDDSNRERFSPSDGMIGGHLQAFRANLRGRMPTLYARIARGYKAGGFNLSLGGQRPAERRTAL